jgi:chromatin licensing and DNA replication factor 1
MPERTFNGFSASKGTSTEFSMPVPTTCIPMEINTASHRVELPKSDRSPVLSSHFSKSFNSCFSLKAGGSFIRNAKKTKDVSPAGSEVRDTILPMPINRTSHRDVHNLAEKPNGTPHLATSFKPFFSVKRSSQNRSELLKIASTLLQSLTFPALRCNIHHCSVVMVNLKRTLKSWNWWSLKHR